LNHAFLAHGVEESLIDLPELSMFRAILLERFHHDHGLIRKSATAAHRSMISREQTPA